jgi:hypothetical protein
LVYDGTSRLAPYGLVAKGWSGGGDARLARLLFGALNLTYSVRTMSTKRRAAKDMTKFNMRIDRKLKEAAEKLAEDDQRSLASLIIKLLTDAVKKRGLLPKKGGR